MVEWCQPERVRVERADQHDADPVTSGRLSGRIEPRNDEALSRAFFDARGHGRHSRARRRAARPVRDAAPTTCPGCRAALPENARFCPACGRRLAEDPARRYVPTEVTDKLDAA